MSDLHDDLKRILDVRANLYFLARTARRVDDREQEQRLLEAFELVNVCLLAETRRTIERVTAGVS